jgi:hypothetical protein
VFMVLMVVVVDGSMGFPAAQVISCIGFRTECYLGAILMAWGYSAYRTMARIV